MTMEARPQVFVGREPPSPERMRPVRNPRYPSLLKPEGGIWTSDLLPDGSCPWVRWCQHSWPKRLEGRHMWLLVPTPGARLLVVGGTELGEAARYCHGGGWIDFESMAAECDGLRVEMPVGPWQQWDVPSTVWFQWAFSEVRYLGPVPQLVELEP